MKQNSYLHYFSRHHQWISASCCLRRYEENQSKEKQPNQCAGQLWGMRTADARIRTHVYAQEVPHALPDFNAQLLACIHLVDTFGRRYCRSLWQSNRFRSI